MAYSELIKNFSRIRDYMREFYLYGFKSRGEYTQKSARSYDNERRRIESILDGYMRFRQTPEGRNVFLSIDSRKVPHNPLYKAWKAGSFTDGDITLHFLLFDILYAPEVALTLQEITEAVDRKLAVFEEPRVFDESTVRKKLKEYAAEGLLIMEKKGKSVRYRRSEAAQLPGRDVLDFFSETAPCGVIGSFLLDKMEAHPGHFAFKHHYITSSMDSEILCALFLAIWEKREVTLETIHRSDGQTHVLKAVPLQIMVSVQSGRQYLMAAADHRQRIRSFRLDNILSVSPGEVCGEYDTLRGNLERMRQHIWGVSTHSFSGARMEHVDFTVRFGPDEEHIFRRLEREKRCGTVERLSEDTARFSADVYDASEMIPWIRTFICRLTELHFSDPQLQEHFLHDLQEMAEMYGVEGGEDA